MDSENTKGGYDYRKLRKKILQSWGQEREEKKEQREVISKESGNTSRKSFYEKRKSIIIKTGRDAPVKEKMTASLPAVKSRKKIRSGYMRPGNDQEQGGSIASSEEAGLCSSLQREEALKKWVIYNAVFGPPRALNPWKPGK